MSPTNQYDCFELAKDITPNIIKGMEGVILEIWADDAYEVEFVKSDGTNYEYQNLSTFTIDKSYIGKITFCASK